MELKVLKEKFMIAKLAPDATLPDWLPESGFVSVTRTSEELSIVCEEKSVSSATLCDRGWRCLKIQGPLDFSLTGILSSIAGPLAKAEISIFSISTYETDYVLVRSVHLEKTRSVLAQAGHRVNE